MALFHDEVTCVMRREITILLSHFKEIELFEVDSEVRKLKQYFRENSLQRSSTINVMYAYTYHDMSIVHKSKYRHGWALIFWFFLCKMVTYNNKNSKNNLGENPDHLSGLISQDELMRQIIYGLQKSAIICSLNSCLGNISLNVSMCHKYDM